jgi:antitoxin component of MazEF toxin-antitoxin module
MRALQKLVRNGNSTQITIPRPILMNLGWLPGNFVVVDLLEGGELRISKLAIDDRRSNGQTMIADAPIAGAAR